MSRANQIAYNIKAGQLRENQTKGNNRSNNQIKWIRREEKGLQYQSRKDRKTHRI